MTVTIEEVEILGVDLDSSPSCDIHWVSPPRRCHLPAVCRVSYTCPSGKRDTVFLCQPHLDAWDNHMCGCCLRKGLGPYTLI